jgi:phytanoyl-CoA hydroxylase
MYIFKNPKIGGEVGAHKDSTFLITDPLSVCGIWISLDSASKENGCMWGVPGSH